MQIKKYKILISLLFICLINNSCGTVKKAFDPERKNSSDEFLVEKKSPLSMPPNLNELPIPKKGNTSDKVNDNKGVISTKDLNEGKNYLSSVYKEIIRQSFTTKLRESSTVN